MITEKPGNYPTTCCKDKTSGLMKLVPMDEAMSDEVAVIEAYSFSEPWSKKSIQDTLKSDIIHFYCLLMENESSNGKCDYEIAGYVGLNRVLEETEITNVAIKKELRGNGLSKLMLRLLIEEEKRLGTKQLFLEVRAGNKPAISAYKSVGFVKNGIRKNFYRLPNEDAIFFSLNLQ